MSNLVKVSVGMLHCVEVLNGLHPELQWSASVSISLCVSLASVLSQDGVVLDMFGDFAAGHMLMVEAAAPFTTLVTKDVRAILQESYEFGAETELSLPWTPGACSTLSCVLVLQPKEGANGLRRSDGGTAGMRVP